MNSAALPLEELPMHLLITPQGIELSFYETTSERLPYKVNIPREQWNQMVDLVAMFASRVDRFEAYVGFTEQSLALHRIDAVEAAPLLLALFGLPSGDAAVNSKHTANAGHQNNHYDESTKAPTRQPRARSRRRCASSLSEERRNPGTTIDHLRMRRRHRNGTRAGSQLR